MVTSTGSADTVKAAGGRTSPTIPRTRLLLFIAALVCLLAGLWGGLLLLGLRVPTLLATTAEEHGVLMALGFLGTVISLERAVALGRPWAFAAPALAGLLATTTGTWRTPYIWFAIAPIVFGALLWFVAPRVQERTAPNGDRFAAFREIGRVFRDVGPVVSLSIAFQFGIAALLAFLALYLVDARGLSPALAAVFFGVPQLVGVIGAPLGGWLSDRYGRRRVMLGGLALMGPAVFAVTIVPNEGLLVALIVFGLLWSMRSTVTETLVMDSAPAGRRATVLGAYYLVNAHVGGIGAPAKEHSQRAHNNALTRAGLAGNNVETGSERDSHMFSDGEATDIKLQQHSTSLLRYED
jgi:hypothetical protein